VTSARTTIVLDTVKQSVCISVEMKTRVPNNDTPQPRNERAARAGKEMLIDHP